MNEDFYYFFSLFKDNCVFNEALNTARYRYGLDPQRYLNLYSDMVNDPGNRSCKKTKEKAASRKKQGSSLFFCFLQRQELSNFTVRCSLIENATNINIDSKTNTRPFKKSFLHRIFTVTDTLPQNVSLLLVFVCSCQTEFPLYQLEEFFSTHRLSFFEPPALPGVFDIQKTPLCGWCRAVRLRRSGWGNSGE